MGECFFWYRPTRVVPDQRPLNGRCRCCCHCCGAFKRCWVHSPWLTQPIGQSGTGYLQFDIAICLLAPTVLCCFVNWQAWCLSGCTCQHPNQRTICSCLVVIHTQPFNGPLSRTILVSRYQKGKTNLDFSEARDSEWQ